MAGRKRRKLKLLAETVNEDEGTATEEGKERLELQTWSDLPVELLELIMSHLTLEDNIRASAVCQRWHKVAISVRVETIKLPRFELTYQIVAFSCAPTSPNCVVFTIKHISPTIVAISTCHPGASKWDTVNHQNRLPFFVSLESVAYHIHLMIVDTIPVNNAMTGESKTPLRTYGLNHPRMPHHYSEERQ
ncbi:hypothetical protein CCACVL1_12008 [Corchorus capsularis]|uniref:F-box domain-containing protein n=1 Tax=Corchorus capsularis TaxID=210143 RepID=A0A1R3II56_COCAP|nr:hypothetical protein CCACVL1_12008 [Corchorus capsularis]